MIEVHLPGCRHAKQQEFIPKEKTIENINRSVKQNWINYMEANPEYFHGVFGYSLIPGLASVEYDQMKKNGLICKAKIGDNAIGFKAPNTDRDPDEWGEMGRTHHGLD